MRVARWNKVGRLTAGIMIAIGAIMVTGGVAASAPTPFQVQAGSQPILSAPDGQLTANAVHGIHFDDQTQTVTFVLPIPACPVAQPNCQWLLYLSLPNAPGQPAAGMVTGSSGILTLPYPAYCGVIQADSLIGPAPWVYMSGLRHTINTCVPPTTTTTTTVPTTTTTSTSTTTTTTVPTTTTTTSTTTTTVPTTTTTTSTSTTTTTIPSNVGAGGSGTPTTTTSPTTPSTTPPTTPATIPPAVLPNGSSALPFTAATVTIDTSSGTVNGSSSLPFTGTDIRPLALLGSLLILIGGLLLLTVESKRRALVRATTLTIGQVKDGARKTGYWFLGH